MDLRPAALMSALSVCNIIVGFAFQALVAALLGTNAVVDVFSAGVAVPTVIATAVLGAAPIVLVPAYSHHLVGEPNALSRRSLELLLLCAALLSIVLFVAASPLAVGLAPGFSSERRHQLEVFLRIVAVVPLLATVAALGQAFAYSARRFGLAGSSAIANGAFLLGATVLAQRDGLTASDLAWSVVIGYLGQVAWVAPQVLRTTRTLTGDSTRQANRTLLITLGFMAVTSIFYKSQPVIERLLGSTVSEGLPAALSYAGRFGQGLTLVASFAVSLVAMPQLADAVAARDWSFTQRIISISLTFTLVTTLCVVGFCVACYQRLPEVVLQRGDFTQDDARVTGDLLLAFVPGIAAGTLAGPLVNAYYALRRQHFVAYVGIAGTALGGLASALLAGIYGGPGITLGTSLGFIITLMVFATRLSSVIPSWSWRAYLFEIRLWLGVGAISVTGLAALGAWLPHPHAAATRAIWLTVLLAASAAALPGLALLFGWRPPKGWIRGVTTA